MKTPKIDIEFTAAIRRTCDAKENLDRDEVIELESALLAQVGGGTHVPRIEFVG
jgi:hypothetical protein